MKKIIMVSLCLVVYSWPVILRGENLGVVNIAIQSRAIIVHVPTCMAINWNPISNLGDKV
ncbi:hypothetical protein CLU79DRAFT_735153, partial [Phycomyces nitens]